MNQLRLHYSRLIRKMIMERDADQRYQQLLDHMPTGLVLFGDAMHLRFANAQARHFMARPGTNNDGERQDNDLRIEIIKLAAYILERETGYLGEDSSPQDAVIKTVRAQQGSFRLRGVRVTGARQARACHVLIVITDDLVKQPRPKTEGRA